MRKYKTGVAVDIGKRHFIFNNNTFKQIINLLLWYICFSIFSSGNVFFLLHCFAQVCSRFSSHKKNFCRRFYDDNQSQDAPHIYSDVIIRWRLLFLYYGNSHCIIIYRWCVYFSVMVKQNRIMSFWSMSFAVL